MKIPQLKSMPALAAGILGLAATSQASLITTIPDLPPLGGEYLSTNIHQIYGGPALEFLLSQPNHKPLANEFKGKQGLDQIESFTSQLDFNLEVRQNGVTVQNGPGQAFGICQTVVHGKYDAVGNENITGTFQTEMLQLNLQGGTLPPGVMIRESPTLQSTGVTSVQNIGGGLYKIDSFFDVFTELSIDGGQTWMPGSDTLGGPPSPGHVTLVPEPTSMSLLAAGFVGMMGFIRRRR